MSDAQSFSSPQEAANDPRILLFGRLLGSANRLEFLLGRELEQTIGISHSTYELLLLVGRARPGGLAVRDIAQARVLTSGGATRLVSRALTDRLVTRRTSTSDARVHLVELTAHGADVVQRASDLHVLNIQRYLIDALPAAHFDAFTDALRILSKSATQSLPTMP